MSPHYLGMSLQEARQAPAVPANCKPCRPKSESHFKACFYSCEYSAFKTAKWAPEAQNFPWKVQFSAMNYKFLVPKCQCVKCSVPVLAFESNVQNNKSSLDFFVSIGFHAASRYGSFWRLQGLFCAFGRLRQALDPCVCIPA